MSELLIEQECLSGVCFPGFYRAGEKGMRRCPRPPFRKRFSGAPETNFGLAAAGEKEHEWGA
ncbi:hypothetical protein CXU15_11720 [Akkermansia muciniphila]|uniref:Uncharacterized protein n=1 Tax=Akkermansia massiliensis TaxID=2927224 RepID=A0AAE6TBA7_9BACT|nr:hypothetical protein CXU15_11720 [Akkermansia muciniphila]QHV62151.1 hypothetical protein DMI76_01615 [Akkermansia massiliensis]